MADAITHTRMSSRLPKGANSCPETLIVASTNAAYGRVHDQTTATQKVMVHTATIMLPIVSIKRQGPAGSPVNACTNVSKQAAPQLQQQHMRALTDLVV